MKKSFSPDRLRLISFIILCVSIAALLPGCVRFTLPPPSVLNLTRLNLEPLRGKVIVIDPGHGGPERGALGRHGLTEAEINLGVSLALWGLLKQSGA
ncbi:MAG: N-acetylmuramoyl-L-alanine amidase CwlD, partial [Deltaproteobacteria bacterium]|nr:N-acetylmuramoyl-L-alanine amidase CwlD [Deltaproteobacteria bacterium]